MASLPYWLIGILAGLASALVYAAAASGTTTVILLAYMAPLPIFIAGLSRGTLTAVIAGAMGLLVMAFFAGVPGAIVFFAIAALAPIWLVRLALLSRMADTGGASAEVRASRAREAHHRAVERGTRDGPLEEQQSAPGIEWYPAGMLVVWTTAIAAVILVLSIVSVIGEDGGIRGTIVQMVNASLVDTEELTAMLEARGIQISASAFLEAVAVVVPAMAASVWVIMTLVNMLLAQSIVARSGMAIRPTPSILDISYPQSSLIGFPVALALAFLPGELGFIGGSLAALLFVPYVLLGLVTIHAISRPWPARTALLILVYLSLLFIGWLVVLVGILGLVDAWLGLRQRYSGGSQRPT